MNQQEIDKLEAAAQAAVRANYEDLHDANLQLRKLTTAPAILSLIEQLRVARKDASQVIELGNALVDGGSVEYTLAPGCRCGMCHGFKITTDDQDVFGDSLSEAIDQLKGQPK